MGFNDPHAHASLRLHERRVNASLYDQLTMRIRKLPGCEVSKILCDFFDGRYNTDPVSERMHQKGRLELDLDAVPIDQWVTLTAPFPAGDVNFTSCRDLYQVTVSIE